MADQQLIAPGFPFAIYVNETDSNQRIAPGVYVNETISSGNTPTNITLAQAAWVWTGRASGINSKTLITLAQAAWTWAGQPVSINAKNIITMAQGAWRWTGRPIGGLVNDAVNYLLGLLGVGL